MSLIHSRLCILSRTTMELDPMFNRYLSPETGCKDDDNIFTMLIFG